MTALKSFPKTPTASYIVEQFSTPKDAGLTYGQRLTGFFVPPESGNYIFAASCTDECQLSISKNDEETKKDLIIDHPVGTTQDQSSDPIALKGGHTYFVEALSYHADGDSPMKVGVRMPSGKILAPIPSQYLTLERGALVDEEFDDLDTSSVRSLLTQTSFPDSPSRWTSLNEFSMAEYEPDGNHGHRTSGYFLATESGKFKFFGSCPHGCRLYLSDDDSCVRRSLVLDYKPPPFKTNRRSSVKTNISETVTEDKDFASSTKLQNSSTLNPLLLNKTVYALGSNENISAITSRGLNLPSLFEVSNTFDLKAGLHYYIEALSASKGDQLESLRIGVVQPSGKTYFPIKKSLLKQFNPSKHGVIRELWKNVKGEEIKDLTINDKYPKIPNEVNLLQSFEAPSNERYNYGQRLKSYFVAPMTGDYRFVMSCDKKCELWMSPTEHEQHKKRILKETQKVKKHEFNKYPSEQVSIPIHMDIGQQYYLEAIHKASTGLDHMSIGVTLPTGQNEWPIPKKYLRFRPKEKVSSHLEVPCNYNLDETTDHKLQTSSKKNMTHHQPVPDQESSRIAQNDLAILGEDVSSNQDVEQIQNDGMSFSNDNLAPSSPSSDEETSNASAKVKVTHLELPFGKPDSHSAMEALKIMKKINQDDKGKVKIEKSTKGKGFTLTGLPSSLNTAEVTKIAKGVASVIEEAETPTGHKITTGAKPLPIKGSFGTMNSPISTAMSAPINTGMSAPISTAPDPLANGLHAISQNLQLSPALSHTESSDHSSMLLQGASVGSNPFTLDNKEEGPKEDDEHNAGENLKPDAFGSLAPPQNTLVNPTGSAGNPVTTVSTGLTGDGLEGNQAVTTGPKEPEIEAVSVIGNLAAAHLSSLKPLQNPTEHLHNHLKPKLPTTMISKDPCSKVCMNFEIIPLHHPCKVICNKKKPGSFILGGDSIGSPVSDMLPGLPDTSQTPNNGINTSPPQASLADILGDGDNTVGGTAATSNGLTETPVSVAGSLAPDNPNELPINKLTDFDVLSVDLDGLKNLPALSPISNQIGLSKSTLATRFGGQEFSSLEGLSDSTFIGNKLNNEANDVESMISGERKKLIPNNERLTSIIEGITKKRRTTLQQEERKKNHIPKHFNKQLKRIHNR